MITSQYRTVLGMIRAKGIEGSPEFQALQEAIEEEHSQLSAIALEVLVSHFRDRFQRVERQFFQSFAQEIRESVNQETPTFAMAS